MNDDLTPFSRFTRDLYSRLKKGQEEYGDESYGKHPLDLIREIKEEALDIAGWGYLLYQRLERLEHKVSAVHTEEYERHRVQAETSTDCSGCPGTCGEGGKCTK